MNTIITSREAILEVSRKLIQKEGWASVNIRAVAAAGNISVGSIYNYFDSKSDLITATIESIWFDIFHVSEGTTQFSDMPSCIEWMYDRFRQGEKTYPDFASLHSMSFMSTEKSNAKFFMTQTWGHIQSRILTVLKKDSRVRPGVFHDAFTEEKFIGFLFASIFFSLIKKDYDCTALVEMIRIVLY